MRNPLARATVRTKILAAVLVISALGMLVTGLLTNAIQRGNLYDDIDRELTQEVEEFRRLAERGIDPDTGEPFTGVEELLRAALAHNVPSTNELFVTMYDGRAVGHMPDAASALQDDPALAAAVAAVPAGTERVVREEMDTEAGRVHAVIVPVHGQGGQSGFYVVASDVRLVLAAHTEFMRTYAIVAFAVLALIGVVAWRVIGSLLRPLAELSETAHAVGETELDLRAPVRGNDDVADLATRFNTMLDRLSGAIGTQRQFLDDAGHELRTPLTVLRGHLELIDPTDEADVVETRDLLLDETARMSRMVEDLVILAAAERPDFVKPAPLDLGRFTDDTLDKMRALGDRTWRLESRADAVVVGDVQRLAQAALQLADNAVEVTEPGTTISLGTSVALGVATLWVRDEGPGIKPEDRERIFERFARAEGTQATRGRGLGLAIVRAVAHGHGGEVTASDGVGRGLRVTLAWPAVESHDGLGGGTAPMAAGVDATQLLPAVPPVPPPPQSIPPGGDHPMTVELPVVGVGRKGHAA